MTACAAHGRTICAPCRWFAGPEAAWDAPVRGVDHRGSPELSAAERGQPAPPAAPRSRVTQYAKGICAFFVDDVEVIVRPADADGSARALKLGRLLAEHAGSAAMREILNGREHG